MVRFFCNSSHVHEKGHMSLHEHEHQTVYSLVASENVLSLSGIAEQVSLSLISSTLAI